MKPSRSLGTPLNTASDDPNQVIDLEWFLQHFVGAEATAGAYFGGNPDIALITSPGNASSLRPDPSASSPAPRPGAPSLPPAREG